jgi:hypothetical protein
MVVAKARTWQARVFAVFLRAAPQPLSPADVILRLNIDSTSVYVALRLLKARGQIYVPPGFKRRYTVTPGAGMPQDGRGKSVASLSNLRKRAPWAARPISVITVLGGHDN